MTTSAREQSSRLADLLRREHLALADFLVALSEFDRVRGWADLEYSTMFDYLHRDLGLSKGAAFYRMTAARLLQAHPEVVEPLKDGRLCLTTIVELSKALEAGGGDEVVSRFFHASKKEAKAVVAELLPAAFVRTRTVVTSVSVAPATPPAPVHPAGLADLGQLVGQPTAAAPLRSAPVLVEEPMTAELSRVHVTVPRRLMKKIEEARAALSHSHPRATEADILEVGLDLVLERHAKRRGLVKNPRPPKVTPAAPPARAAAVTSVAATAAASGSARSSRRRRDPIPAHVKRGVWRRDGGRCQWPVDGGGVCGSTWRVQLDHIVPVALGGEASVENLRCLCGAHNDRAARQVFGDAHMDRFTRGADRSRPDA